MQERLLDQLHRQVKRLQSRTISPQGEKLCAVKRNRRWETGRVFRAVRGEEEAFYWGIAEEAGNRSIEMQVDV